MRKNKTTIQKAFLEVVLQAGLMILAVVVFRQDARNFDQFHSEYSITEYTQTGLILFSSLLFAVAAYRRPASRGFLVLVAGFFASMFFRECDAYLDFIVHGFWVYPAVAVAALTIYYASRCKYTVAAPLAAFTETKAFSYIAYGLLTLMIFSRLFGTSSLWQMVMGPDYSNQYRSAIQEGIELLGYIFVAYGSMSFLFFTDRPTKSAK